MTTRAATLSRLAIASALALAGCEKPEEPEVTSTTTQMGVEMVLCPAGEFVMGTNGGDEDESPARKIRVGAFHIDAREVTQKHYEGLMGKNPAKFTGPLRPVERLSWFAAIKYCNARSLREGLTPCYDPKTGACDYAADGYRLPTEAEWEYACRAGTKGSYSFGGAASALGRYGWFKGNAGKATHPVGVKRPNRWGLHDMHGNVAEWCNDHYAGKYDPAATADPRGPAAGKERILRGGSWRSPADRCRSAARNSEPPGLTDVCFGYEAYGFRCVRRAPQRPKE
jgi:formylglycine-generating enzyme required for sulfatase activity